MSDPIKPHPAGQLINFTVQFTQPWQVVRPRVFRFLPQKYVDDFFADGSLRLSSFNQFAKHADEERKDGAEGKGVRTGIGEQATVFLASGVGSDCYVLCGSLIYSDQMRRTFPGADGSFVIDDTMGFAGAIARALPGFKGGMEGPAIYQDDTTIRRDMGPTSIEELVDAHKRPDNTIDMNLLLQLQGQVGGTEEFFTKHSRYANQAEYRLLWGIDGHAQDFIDLKVPAARQFCRKLT